MWNDPAVVDLVHRARDGDQTGWDELVERYAPLLWSICRRYRLSMEDSQDVGQSVWLHLVEHLSTLREPAALPGWIATTTQRECLRLLRRERRTEPPSHCPTAANSPTTPSSWTRSFCCRNGDWPLARPSTSCPRAAGNCCRC